MRYLRLILITLASMLSSGTHQVAAGDFIAADDHAAVILAYFRVGENYYPDSNIRTGQFSSHIQEIIEGGYNVLPVPEIIAILKSGGKLPRKTIGITFEGAYKSILKNAAPLLLEKEIPFTVFYASSQADSQSDQYMRWGELRELKKNDLVTLGVFPTTYGHISNQPDSEIRRHVNKARQAHRERFNEEARLFSYPFGEYSQIFKTVIADSGFDAAFGMQSGVFYADGDYFAVPRFTMTELYGDTARFRLVGHALPLPVFDIEPEYSYVNDFQNMIGFSVEQNLKSNLGNLSCYLSGQREPEIETLGNRVEVRMSAASSQSRLRLNCTMPGPKTAYSDDVPTWRWFGLLLSRAEKPNIPNLQAEDAPPPLPE